MSEAKPHPPARAESPERASRRPRNDDRPAHRMSAIPHEARPFQGHRAGLVTRAIAAAVDGLMVAAISGGLYMVWSALAFAIDPPRFTFPVVPAGGWLVGGYVVAVVYLALFWSATGVTVGSRVLGLRVVDSDGRRLRHVVALARAAFCVIFPIGLAWVAFSVGNRSLQDAVLRTSVLYDWHPRHDPHAPSGTIDEHLTP